MGEVVPLRRSPIPAVGAPYMPSNGTEGAEFEDALCAKCDRYRENRVEKYDDCTVGHLQTAMTEQPKAWVYGENGPTCLDWIARTAAADERQPRLCANAATPNDERKAYEKAMRGE